MVLIPVIADVGPRDYYAYEYVIYRESYRECYWVIYIYIYIHI